jgi:hypothetical protein
LAAATRQRLFGWRGDALLERMTPLWPNKDGSLWREKLASFLVPDGQLLRLTDRNRQVRLTEAEARAQQVKVLAEKLRSLGVDPDQL